MNRAEHCKNPWNGKCRNTDIEVFILYKDNKLPICSVAGAKYPKATLSGASPQTLSGNRLGA